VTVYPVGGLPVCVTTGGSPDWGLDASLPTALATGETAGDDAGLRLTLALAVALATGFFAPVQAVETASSAPTAAKASVTRPGLCMARRLLPGIGRSQTTTVTALRADGRHALARRQEGRTRTLAAPALLTTFRKPLTCGNVFAAWRWRWDLNPRRAFTLTRFRGVRARPLRDSTAGEPSGPRDAPRRTP
jgi:hypothetical protein